MSQGNGAAEKSYGSAALVQNCPKSRAGGIALHNKGGAEIWQMKYRCCGQSRLERPERREGCFIP